MNIKAGIDYFSFDVDFFQDDKIQFISARFGLKGEAVTVRLLCKIYRNGYYINWDDDTALLFAKSVGDGCTDSLVNDIVHELVKRGFFNESILNRFGILTSKGIQKRYLESTKRRKDVSILKDLLLAKVSEYQNVYILNENVYILSQYVNNSEQNVPESKVKKVKESRESNNAHPRETFTPPCLEEVQAYCRERNKGVNPEKWMNFYSAKGWMIGKNPMKDWKAAVRTWEKEQDKPPETHSEYGF